ncbi:MAG: hypothetical protein IPH48_07640 [bacterium]|nr:hypothetical protein [bacterium]
MKMRRPRGKGAGRLRKLDELLDRAAGRNPERWDSRDREGDRRRERGPTSRVLDVRRDREIFERLTALDYDFLLCQRFAAGPRVLGDLLPQSVVGRAQNGHGWFTDEFGVSLRFPDATFERVLSVLERIDPNLRGTQVRERRGALVTRFGQWLLANADRPRLTLDVDGGPPLGIDFLAGHEVDTRAFCTGMILAGFMDDWQHRRTAMMQHKRTFGGHPFSVGGGEIVIVDREKFELCGLEDPGATVLEEDQLRELRDFGIICRDPNGAYSFPEHDQVYFRRRLGDGVCDDLALIWVAASYGYDALLGAFLMDGIDTYDKYLLDLTWGGYDTLLAGRLQDRFLDLDDKPLVSDERIFDLIHFAAKRNDPILSLSSSHRRLIQYETGAAVPTVLNHWRFVMGEPVYDIRLGYARLPAEEFYAGAWHRLEAAGLPVPAPRFVKGRKER